jgi:hypothetical protein
LDDVTFEPGTFRDLANWILLGIGLVLSALLPRLTRRLRSLLPKRSPTAVNRPATIHDSGTVTARVTVSAVEAVA